MSNAVLVERLSERLAKAFVSGKSLRPILVEFFTRNLNETSEAEFNKVIDNALFKILSDLQDETADDPTAGNFKIVARKIANSIKAYVAKLDQPRKDKIAKDEADKKAKAERAAHLQKIRAGLRVHSDDESTHDISEPTVMNPQPSKTVLSHTTYGKNFKSFMEYNDLNKNITKIIKESFNSHDNVDNIVSSAMQNLLLELFGFGQKKEKKPEYTYEDKLEALFGEKADERLQRTFGQMLKYTQDFVDANKSQFDDHHKELADKLITTLKKLYQSTGNNEKAYEMIKKFIPESSIKSQQDKKTWGQYLFGGETDYDKAQRLEVERDAQIYFKRLGLNLDDIAGKNVDEVWQQIETSLAKIPERGKVSFLNWWKQYSKKLAPVVAKIIQKQVAQAKQSGEAPPQVVLSRLGDRFKNKWFGMLAFGTIIYAKIIGLTSEQAVDLANKVSKGDTTLLDKVQPDSGLDYDKASGGAGGGPDTTGQSGQLQQHLDGLADQLEKLSPGFQKEMTEPGNILKNLIEKAYGAGDTSPEELAQLLEQNPKLAQFLDGLNFNSLDDVNKAIEKADSLGLNFNQLKSLTQKLHDIANKPAQDAKPATSAFGDYSKARDAGNAPAQAAKVASKPLPSSKGTKIVQDTIHGGTAEVEKKGVLGSIGRALLGTTDVSGQKVKPGLLGKVGQFFKGRGR